VSSRLFRVRITASAKNDLRRIGKRYGKKTYQTIRDLIRGLEVEPDKKGEPLRGRLRGLYSCHYSRFRVVYRIDQGELSVLVVGTGYHEADSRTDIYKVLERLVESGRLVIQEDAAGGSTKSDDTD